MTGLNTAPNLPDPDGFYANLILANHIGDHAVLSDALAAAVKTNRSGE